MARLSDVGKRPRLVIIVGVYFALWIVLSLHPVDRADWAMENVLVFLIWAVLITGWRWFQFSDLSYGLIFLFLTLHEFGAHYTYDKVPLGYWLKNTFHFARNDYDRIVHFSFGFCWAYPVREFLRNAARIPQGWSYYIPLSAVLAWSAVYEIIEAYTAQWFPGQEEQFVGMQGDIFDSQRDMTCALMGAVLCMVLVFLAQKRAEHEDSGP